MPKINKKTTVLRSVVARQLTTFSILFYSSCTLKLDMPQKVTCNLDKISSLVPGVFHSITVGRKTNFVSFHFLILKFNILQNCSISSTAFTVPLHMKQSFNVKPTRFKPLKFEDLNNRWFDFFRMICLLLFTSAEAKFDT